MTKWCGRCLVLVVVWSCYTGFVAIQEFETELLSFGSENTRMI